jgi:hypothetical protein
MSIDLSQQYTFNNKDPKKKVLSNEELVKLQSKQLDVSLSDTTPELPTIDSKAPQLQTNIPNNSQPDSNFGEKLQANAGNILTFGVGAYQQLNQTAQSDKEADARTLSLAASGASAGMTVGGPWGAAIGGAIGLGAGLLKKVPDRKKRLIDGYKKYENKIFEETNTRDALAEDDMRKAEVESLMDLKKAQMGLINLNY